MRVEVRSPSGTAEELARQLRDARARTLQLVLDLDDAQWMGPRLKIVNPILWEIGHQGWFQEKWIFRRDGRPSILPNADALYDSTAIPHDVRWDLPLRPRNEVLRYIDEVLERAIDKLLSAEPTPEDAYFYRLVLFHEDMHGEAFMYTRQTLSYPEPKIPGAGPGGRAGPLAGDIEVPAGRFQLGALREEPFVFDNEKWAHFVEVKPFRIARAPVTNAEFAEFVDAGGYRESRHWSREGWVWRERERAEHPVYWRRTPGGGWEFRRFDRHVSLAPNEPIIHVNAFEAEAWCRWAGRRLPTEAEWEFAASWDPRDGRKRRFPWGDAAPTPERANLDARGPGCVDAAAHAAGDSPVGCRQMIGNIWEWTASDFLPYPGFVPDPYKEYSEPWFGTHRVLRGGCWATRARLLRNTWRNFYTPDRRDVFAGFRTCAP